MGAEVDPKDAEPSFEKFSILYCGILVGALLFPLLIMKQIGILIKLNSYGIYFVSIIMCYVIYVGFKSMLDTKFDFEYRINDGNEPRHLYLFGENPSLLAGSLTMGYFSHSFVLSMMKNNENQENNKRDLFYGYCLVCLTFIILGIFGYVGFSGKNFNENFQEV
jgi:hypothetical protein